MGNLPYIPPATELQFWPRPLPAELQNEPKPWILEIGPGKGEFILDQAQKHPRTIFVAIELKRGRFEKISRRAQQSELQNLYVVLGDARECLQRLFPPGLFERIYILFPDPWPKRRHAKHRLLNPRLIKELKEILQVKGELIAATDVGFYSDQIVQSFEEVGGFTGEKIESLFPTYFEQKWKALGREIAYWRFVRD